MASPGTLAHIAVGKYLDGLPLYRQEKKLNRIGVDLPRSTLAACILAELDFGTWFSDTHALMKFTQIRDWQFVQDNPRPVGKPL